MKRALAAAAAAALLSATVPAQASQTRLSYVEKPLSDSAARRMWSDMAAEAKPLGQYAPWVYIATVDIGNGRTLTVTQLWAGGACGVRSCPLRVYEGDERLAEADACDNIEEHVISDDGRVLVTCDIIVRTNRR